MDELMSIGIINYRKDYSSIRLWTYSQRILQKSYFSFVPKCEHRTINYKFMNEMNEEIQIALCKNAFLFTAIWSSFSEVVCLREQLPPSLIDLSFRKYSWVLRRFKSQMWMVRARERKRIFSKGFKNNAFAPHREYAFVKSFVLCAHATGARDEKSQAAIKSIRSDFFIVNKKNKGSWYYYINYYIFNLWFH